MTTCNTCSKRVSRGGIRFGNELYCSDECGKRGLIAASEEYLTEEIVRGRIEEVHLGACPVCGGPGPNDLQWHYTIWSIIILTTYKEIPEVCCKKCGIKKKTRGFFFSLLFGWWGIPVGIIMTPVQVIRNVIAFFKLPQKGKPSKKLEEIIRMDLGAEALFEKANIESEQGKLESDR